MGEIFHQRNECSSWERGLQLLDEAINTPSSIRFGSVQEASRVTSLSRGKDGVIHPETFRTIEYRVEYPQSVKNALFRLYDEYNQAFLGLTQQNAEWETDYAYAFADGNPVNRWVQIDMVGLPESFLNQAKFYPEDMMVEVLRRRIFEIENSLAMYQLLREMFSSQQQDSIFKREFEASLDALRRETGMPIALLAVTPQKYEAMKLSEFGKKPEEPLSDKEVRSLSGFDRFFGPDEFEQYVHDRRGNCEYLLYARTSDPLAKLRDPRISISVPLLENPEMRRIIRSRTVTFNIDDPTWSVGDSRRINDTKAWMPLVHMGYMASQESDIIAYVPRGKEHLPVPSESLLQFLGTRGMSFDSLDQARNLRLRAKPAQASYGCYGHISGSVSDKEFRSDLRKNLERRGPYIIQPELRTPIVTDSQTGQQYVYIDRNFIWTDGKKFHWMGGFRSYMPIDSPEAQKGRNHGSRFTVWGQIV